ncbi:MAG: class I SAM-dependent methyltransferase [Acidobacteriota bacterium]
MFRDKIDSTANLIFGPEDSKEKSRWIEYWQAGKNRYKYYLEQLRRIMQTDFIQARVLDLGCGAGGLDSLLGDRCLQYVGIDYKMHILLLTPPSDHAGFVQGNGISLPFPDSSFDYIFALDVLEHLSEGVSWQKEFMKEIRRVLSPLGIALLSTPNFWYPYDAHSRTYCSQFMPVSAADKYIGRRNPDFIKEHQSFGNIHLLRPGRLRKIIREADLAPLHSLPCCLDKNEYLKLHPLLGLLPFIGLGWIPHAEFWMILARKTDRKQLRIKLKKNFHFQLDHENPDYSASFQPEIDFSKGSHSHQLGRGWHWPETPGDNFRWIKRQAYCYLEGLKNSKELRISGHSPIETRLFVYCDDQLLGIHQAGINEVFKLRYPLPFKVDQKHLFAIKIQSTQQVIKDKNVDSRELAVQVFSVGVTE